MSKERDSEIRNLEESVDSVEEKMTELSSTRNVFKLGIIRGLGSAFGATIIFAIVMGLLAWFVGVTNIPWIERIIPETEVGRVLTE